MIHALPGMGANRRMYPHPWGSIPNIALHDWPRYSGERTLSEVARSVCDACQIQDGDAIVGASLGGMVACEIAKIRDLHALYLVGSALNKDEISRLLKFLHPLSAAVPVSALCLSAGSIPFELTQMLSGADAGFVRAMCRAVFQWEGLGLHPVPRFRIHGRNDLVIPAPQKADLLLDGEHLISMTHPDECVNFISAQQRLLE